MATQNANTDAKFIKFHSRKFIKCKKYTWRNECVYVILSELLENKVEYPLSPEHKFTVSHGLIPQTSHMRIWLIVDSLPIHFFYVEAWKIILEVQYH